MNRRTCPACHGTGIVPGPIDQLSGKPDEHYCPTCDGTGERTTCTDCGTPLRLCSDCHAVHCNEYGCSLLPVDCEREMRRWDAGDQARAEAKEAV